MTLLKTRYNVRRAELEVKRNPIIAEIDGKKNVLTLEQQKRALQQLETDIAARNEQAESQLAVLNEQRNKSLIDVQREMQRIALCKTLAPMTGLVAIRQNRAGNFNFGQTMPDIRRAIPCSRACPWPTLWIFPISRYGPRSASWIAPT